MATRRFRVFLFPAVLAGQFALAAPVEADGGRSAARVLVTVPRGFPADLATPLAGKLLPDNRAGRTWMLKLPGRESVPAQRADDTGKVLFIAAIDEGAHGKRLTFSARPAAPNATVSIRPVEGGFLFTDGGRPVMRYQREPESRNGQHTRANYVHPLYGLDGERLTQDFPDDHPHHRGVFWAWHQLRVGGRQAGDSWVNRDFLSVVREAEVLDEGPVFATLRVKVHWTSPRITGEDGDPRPFVEETTHIRLFHAASGSQCVDFTIRLKPLLTEVAIGGADNVKEYSGFTVRLQPPGDMTIADANGILQNDGLKRVSPWADVSGRFGQGERRTGVGILTHPSLPGFPPRWLLRHYGMQNVIYPGRKPVELDPDKPLVLRHRLILHRAGFRQARIPEQQKAYALGW